MELFSGVKGAKGIGIRVLFFCAVFRVRLNSVSDYVLSGWYQLTKYMHMHMHTHTYGALQMNLEPGTLYIYVRMENRWCSR